MYMYVHINIYMYMYVYINIYVCVYIHICVCLCVYMHVCVFMCIYTYMCVYIYAVTNIHAHTPHTFIYNMYIYKIISQIYNFPILLYTQEGKENLSKHQYSPTTLRHRKKLNSLIFFLLVILTCWNYILNLFRKDVDQGSNLKI